MNLLISLYIKNELASGMHKFKKKFSLPEPQLYTKTDRIDSEAIAKLALNNEEIKARKIAK